MATITDFTSFSDHELYEEVESASAAVADTILLTGPVSLNLPHLFANIAQFDVSNDPALGGAGTYTIEALFINSSVWEPLPGSPVSAAAPMTLNFAFNVAAIRVTPSGVTGPAVTYTLTLTGNGH